MSKTVSISSSSTTVPAQVVEYSDSEDEEEERNAVRVTAPVYENYDSGAGEDKMYSINSAMFTHADWAFIESDRSNNEFNMKLAEFGRNVDGIAAEIPAELSEEDYMFLKTTFMAQIGSWSSKYLAPAVAVVVEETKKGKKGGKKDSKGKKDTAEKIRAENTQKLHVKDIETMKINDKVSATEVTKWNHPTSLFVYMVYWGLHVVHALKDKYKVNNKLVPVSAQTALDCYMSLYRATKSMSNVAPPSLVADAAIVDGLLNKYVGQKSGGDILGTIFTGYPQLISTTVFDTIKPKSIQLYEEQEKVLKLVHKSLQSDDRRDLEYGASEDENQKPSKPVLIGYQVPPSGGKTILSVAIASMMSFHHRSKRLLYVCYNSLVRLAVANACAQGGIPFWVASMRVPNPGEKPVYAMRPSNACLNMSRRAKRERFLHALSSNFRNKEGPMNLMVERADKLTVHHAPIIIADLACAVELLKLYPDSLVAYVDEPTAGAERGLEGNVITGMISEICSLLPAQSVLLSATLPELNEELPVLANDFTERHGPATEVEMIHSLRLPVGCDALNKMGHQVLPHQLAESFDEFRIVVNAMGKDALMQRFYTPGSVRQIAKCIGDVAKDTLPVEYRFEQVIPHAGAIQHAIIRSYAIKLLSFVMDNNRMDIFDALKAFEHALPIAPCAPVNLLQDHCVDGRALAVAVTDKAVAGEEFETLEEIVDLAMTPYSDKLPKLNQIVSDYEKQCESWNAKSQSLKNSKVSKKDKDALGTLQEMKQSHDESKPSFNWPVKVHGLGAGLSMDEIKEFDESTGTQLLSGIGIYDPVGASAQSTANQAVIREAGEGHLACLFASPYIVYGTNLDLVTVYIATSYSHSATRNALYQLIGRAGRTGKSHRAKVLFQDNLALRKAMIPSPENTEAQIMQWHLTKIINMRSGV